MYFHNSLNALYRVIVCSQRIDKHLDLEHKDNKRLHLLEWSS